MDGGMVWRVHQRKERLLSVYQCHLKMGSLELLHIYTIDRLAEVASQINTRKFASLSVTGKSDPNLTPSENCEINQKVKFMKQGETLDSVLLVFRAPPIPTYFTTEQITVDPSLCVKLCSTYVFDRLFQSSFGFNFKIRCYISPFQNWARFETSLDKKEAAQSGVLRESY